MHCVCHICVSIRIQPVMATHPSPGTAGIPVETGNLAKLAENAIGSRRLILTTQTHCTSKHLRQFTYQTLCQRLFSLTVFRFLTYLIVIQKILVSLCLKQQETSKHGRLARFNHTTAKMPQNQPYHKLLSSRYRLDFPSDNCQWSLFVY